MKDTAYYIEAIIITPQEVECSGRWLIRAFSREAACRDLIHRLATNGCRVYYYTRIKVRSLMP
jgi:hypothetical protein